MPSNSPKTTAAIRQPPAPGLRSIEAEQSVLGGLLIDSSRFADVSSLIAADAFSHDAYRRIFGAIGELVTERAEVDVITVHDRLSLHGDADACGGLVHLNELAQSVPSASAAARYAAIVADRAKRRAMLSAIEDARDLIVTSDSAESAMDELQARLGNLHRTSARMSPRRLGELATRRLEHIQAIADGTQAAGMPTGLPKLDTALGGGLKPGHVIVLAARPSVGKTSLALQILLSMASSGHHGLMLSQEMTGSELAGRAIAHRGGIAMDRLATAELHDDEWGRLPDAAEALAGLPVWVDDQPALRLMDIAAKAREVKREAGGRLDVLVVDYLQLCAAEQQGKGGTAASRHHQIEAISRGIKALAKELGCAVLLLSQLTRAAEDGEPELWHLKESGAVEEDADVVLLMHPAGLDGVSTQIVCLKVAKNRGGRRGRMALALDGRLQRWESSNVDVSRRGARKEGGDE